MDKVELLRNYLNAHENNSSIDIPLVKLIKLNSNEFKLYEMDDYIPNENGYKGDTTISTYTLVELIETLSLRYPLLTKSNTVIGKILDLTNELNNCVLELDDTQINVKRALILAQQQILTSITQYSNIVLQNKLENEVTNKVID